MTHDLDEVEAFLGLISYEDWVAQGEAPPGGGRFPGRPLSPRWHRGPDFMERSSSPRGSGDGPGPREFVPPTTLADGFWVETGIPWSTGVPVFNVYNEASTGPT